MQAMPTCLTQAHVGTFRPFSVSTIHRSGPFKSSFANIGRIIRCSAADGPSSRGRTKSGRQQRRDAADTAKRGVDDAADSLKSGIRSAEDAMDDASDSAKDAVPSAEDARRNPRAAAYDATSSSRSGADDAAANLRGAVRDAEDAVGPQRESAAGAARAARGGINSAADAVDDASRAAERYAADPEAAVDDAADAVAEGISSTADAVEGGIDQAREYVEEPKLAVSDAADAAEEGVDSVADGLKAGVRGVRQGLADGADAAEEAAEDAAAEAETQSQPRIGARPVTVSYASGAGATQVDTSTSSGPVAVPAAPAEDAADAAREAGAQVDDVADEVERNIDVAAEQVEGAIEAAGDRLEGAIDDAPRQTAAVLQQAVDSTADSIKAAQRTADNVREDFEELQAPGPAAPFAATPLTSLPTVAPEKDDVSYQKKRLLFSVAGLDRGFAANAAAELAVETAIYSLVGAAGGSPPLTWTAKEGANGDGQGSSTLGQLSGTWRLVYSSGFASGSLGGQRPGPPAALVPVTIGQVYQVIATATATLDNVVEFYVRTQLPSLPGLPAVEPIVATLRLRHSLEILPASNVQITFEDTQLSVTGGLGGVLGKLPEFTVPQLPEPLKPSRSLRSSVFEVLFLDDDLRITRGDCGELRVFVRT